MKFSAKAGADAGSFAPIAVGPSEIVLTSVTLKNIAVGDRIALRAEIVWDKPNGWDIGELEIFIRKDRADGQIVYWNIESCYVRGRTVEGALVKGERPIQHFYLTARSAESRARIVGPYSLQGNVYAP